MSKASYDAFMQDARQFAAQCWCDEETSHIPRDSALLDAVAKRIAVWMETSAYFQGGMEFYRGLLEQCGQIIGPDAYISDDGSVQDSVIVLKIPELVQKMKDMHGDNG